MFFRSLRARLGVLTSSRVPIRLNSALQHAPPNETPIIRRVRLRKHRTIKRFFLYGATIYFGYEIWEQAVGRQLQKIVEVADSLPVPPGYEEGEDDGTLFIPFPGTTRQVNPPPYKGSDPEWQEFLKFSKDKGRQQRCRDDLALFVCNVVKQAPVLARYGNTAGVKSVRQWLTIDYPSRPPPEFMRSGIEWTDEDIAWTSKHVDPDAVHRIKKALWPTAYGISLYAFFKTLIVQDVRNMLEAFGIQTNKPATFDSLMAERMKNLGQLSAPKPGGPSRGSLDKSLPATGDQKQNQTPAQTVPDGLSNRNALPSDDGSGKAEDPADGSAVGKARELMRGLEKNMIAPLVEAKKSLQKNWRHSIVQPTRGSVLVWGLIECELPKAIVTIDVTAWYDPKEGTYDTRSMVLNLRRLAPKRQGPARAA